MDRTARVNETCVRIYYKMDFDIAWALTETKNNSGKSLPIKHSSWKRASPNLPPLHDIAV